ncbi:MAG: oligopeptide:H+ symporter [Rhabdochlamydiaceae bacterium]
MALFKQPKAVFLLAFVQLWNRFSHYGMRALLLLYMINMQMFSDGAAIGIFAVYCALVELGGVFGAYLAQRFLGLRRAVMVGGWLIGIGHLLLALEMDFFIALGFVIVGSCLYTTNVATLLGEYYPEGDERREQGFTIFYMSINVGAFAATLLCGYFAETFGWHLGFGLAAIGMVLANVSLLCFRKHLLGKGEPPVQKKRSLPVLAGALTIALGLAVLAMHHHPISVSMIPWIAGGLLAWIFTRLSAKALMISAAGLILFFAAEEQISSSLLIFADRLGNGSVPAMSLLAINPLTIILGGPLASAILGRLKSPAMRLLLPFTIAACAFGMLYVLPPGLFLIGSMIGLISFAELLVGPATYSACSEAALTQKDPKIMALMPLGFAMAASLGGVFSQRVAGDAFDIERYGNGFGLMALGLLIAGGILAALWKARKIKEPVVS